MQSSMSAGECYKASLASMSDPKQKLGKYWGYQTRIARSFKDLLEGCPQKVLLLTLWKTLMTSPNIKRSGTSEIFRQLRIATNTDKSHFKHLLHKSTSCL